MISCEIPMISYDVRRNGIWSCKKPLQAVPKSVSNSRKILGGLASNVSLELERTIPKAASLAWHIQSPEAYHDS